MRIPSRSLFPRETGPRAVSPSKALLAASIVLAAPARAEILPPPEQIALAEERAILQDTFETLFGDPGADGPKHLAALDAALARLDQPSRSRAETG